MKKDKGLLPLVQEVPYRLLEQLLAKKLKAAGVEDSEAAAKGLAQHIRSKKKGEFKWDDGKTGKRRSIALEITERETEELLAKSMTFVTDTLPEVLDRTTDTSAAQLLEALKRKWPEQAEWQNSATAQFRKNLEVRWGKGLDLLRMFLTIFREEGEELHKRLGRRKTIADPATKEVLIRTHARACQVTDEIVTLLENGFADGAMARWRTLHELCVTALFIVEHGEDVALRFLDHRFVEARKGLDDYERLVAQGHRPIAKARKAAIQKAYVEALKKYGKEFRTQYGWASKALKHAQPTFRDLETAVQRGTMRSYYQMAGYNVHASARGLYFRLGSLRGHMIAGRSNAGLTEPAQNTAFTLAAIHSLLNDSKHYDVIRITSMKAIVKIRDEIPDAFVRAEKRLARDDRLMQRMEAQIAEHEALSSRKPKQAGKPVRKGQKA